MEVIINYPKDEEKLIKLKKNSSYVKAMLILKGIERLKVSDENKKKILNSIIAELEKKEI